MAQPRDAPPAAPPTPTHLNAPPPPVDWPGTWLTIRPRVVWTPSHLDRHLARFLVITSAGDVQLTAGRLRAAFREGGEPLLRQPDVPFASLLARKIPGTGYDVDEAAVHALPHRLTQRT